MGFLDKIKNISDAASSLASGVDSVKKSMSISEDKPQKASSTSKPVQHVPDSVVTADGKTVINTVDGMSNWLQGMQGGNLTPSATQALQSQIQVLNFVKSPTLTGMAVDTMIMCLYKALRVSGSAEERDGVRESFALMIQSFMFFNEAQLQYAINSNKEEGRQLLSQAGDVLSKSVVSVATLVATGGASAAAVGNVVVKNVFAQENGQQSFFGKVISFIGNKKMIEEKKKQHVDTLKNMFKIFDQYAELIGPSIVLHGMLGRYGNSLVSSFEEMKFKPLFANGDVVDDMIDNLFNSKKRQMSGYEYLIQHKQDTIAELNKAKKDLEEEKEELHALQKKFEDTPIIKISSRNELKDKIEHAKEDVKYSQNSLKEAEEEVAKAEHLLEKGEIIKGDVDAYRTDIERIVDKFAFDISAGLTALSSAPSAAPLPPPPPSQTMYHISVNGQTVGPYAISQMQEMVNRGELTRETLVWCQGMGNWEKATNVSELSSLFGTIPPPPPQL